MKEVLRRRLNSKTTIAEEITVCRDRQQLSPRKMSIQLHRKTQLLQFTSQRFVGRAKHRSRNLERERAAAVPNVAKSTRYLLDRARPLFTTLGGAQSLSQGGPDRVIGNCDRRIPETCIGHGGRRLRRKLCERTNVGQIARLEEKPANGKSDRKHAPTERDRERLQKNTHHARSTENLIPPVWRAHSCARNCPITR